MVFIILYMSSIIYVHVRHCDNYYGVARMCNIAAQHNLQARLVL